MPYHTSNEVFEEQPLISVGLAVNELVKHGVEEITCDDGELIAQNVFTKDGELFYETQIICPIINGEVLADKVLAWLGY